MENTINNIVKIALYGDSLACPRIGIVDSHERYIALIETYLRKENRLDYLEIRDKATGGITLPELYSIYTTDNTYYKLPGDYLILHTGVVDCAPRPIEESVKEKINKLPRLIKPFVIRYIHNNRAAFIKKNNGGYVKTKPEKFAETLNIFLSHASKNYRKIFVINICPTNDRIKMHSPGFQENIKKYNMIITKEISALNANNIVLIDIHKELSNVEDIHEYIVEQDGHHIHPLTHKIIANKIISFLQ